jgi:hypothetical protein
MPEEFKIGCQRPPLNNKDNNKQVSNIEGQPVLKEEQSMVKVGKSAPEFTAPAFYQGKFMNVSLSEYIGKWVLLCFYPGDFTFV